MADRSLRRDFDIVFARSYCDYTDLHPVQIGSYNYGDFPNSPKSYTYHTRFEEQRHRRYPYPADELAWT